MFTAALFTIARIWKQLECPSDEWKRKMWCIYMHTMEYYSAIKKILPSVPTWMDLEIIRLYRLYSVTSTSLRSHGLWPTRLLCP